MIYVRGAFKESDVPMTALALAGYSIGLTGYAAIKVLSPAFYALDDAKTPMIIALGSIVVNAVASFFFRNWLSNVGVSPETPNGYGHVGVALATSTVALVNFFALAWFMKRRIKRLNGRDVLSSFLRIAIASAIMSAVAYFSYQLLINLLGIKSFLNKLIETFIPIAAAGLTFIVAAKLLRIRELEKLFDTFSRRFGGRKLT